MKRRIVFSNKMVVGIVVVSIILFSFSLETETTTSPSSNYQKNRIFKHNLENPSSFDLTPHATIEIDSDEDFISYGFPGSGNITHPYIIENYNITTTNDTGIYITGTSKYFLIRNCYVDAESYGIHIEYVADGTTSIINNTCSNNNWSGIYLYSSSGSTVTNNTCTNNYGIFLSFSSGSTLTENTCSNNEYGIYLYASSDSTLTENTCTNNNYGIFLSFSSGSTLINNTCSNNNFDGILLGDSSDATLTNNTCSNNNQGIYLWESSGATLRDNTCSNNEYGISLSSSSGSSILTDNICTFNNVLGISLSSSSGSTLTNNTCSNNNYEHGIYLESSPDSILTDNTCSNNDFGILLGNSSGSILTDNICTFNNVHGISLSSSSDVTLTNNTCSNNIYGIYLYDSDSCLLTSNLLQENEEHGIYLYSGSDDNIIYHNTFVYNNLGDTSQAIDEGKKNTWYDSETNEGNWWSDLESKCVYKINGDAHSKDLYPLNRAPNCPTNPVFISTISVVLPILVSSAILSFVGWKYVIPYTRNTIIPNYHKRAAERRQREAERRQREAEVRKRAAERRLQIPEFLLCPNCGTNVESSSSFCENCGTTLPKRKTKEITRYEMLKTLEVEKLKSRKASLNISRFLVIFFIVLAIGAEVYLALMMWMIYAWTGSFEVYNWVLMIICPLFILLLAIVMKYVIGPYRKDIKKAIEQRKSNSS